MIIKGKLSGWIFPKHVWWVNSGVYIPPCRSQGEKPVFSQANFQEDPLDLAMFRKTLVEPTAQYHFAEKTWAFHICWFTDLWRVKKMNGNKQMNGTTLKKTNGFTTLNSEPIHLTCRGEFIAPAICTESATGRKKWCFKWHRVYPFWSQKIPTWILWLMTNPDWL